jgi:hypothetical protein
VPSNWPVLVRVVDYKNFASHIISMYVQRNRMSMNCDFDQIEGTAAGAYMTLAAKTCRQYNGTLQRITPHGARIPRTYNVVRWISTRKGICSVVLVTATIFVIAFAIGARVPFIR